ncbi:MULTISPECIES: EF-hand domain-containing protein [unclassified Kitasatospora]|uniref:EF-hand domain-containing protein n=1 Tax=unclassified Kitasatospora TaxID=2633591 RepID=UPI002475EE4E|nr:EF-hand domain-containing protein [Kitasatospora sp. MAA19]MDH6707795.1 Ca2+-binding EF-hand superfamily protein [Kitasatospora sp. MAA19]
METTEAIKAMFDRFDKDGDGKITPAEYALVANEMGDHDVTISMAEALIHTMDTDHDGVLTFAEFLAARRR